MFGFSIRYLTNLVVAADVRTGNEKRNIEWPPHPDRLFSALVQSWADFGSSDQDLASLKWLERQGSPHVSMVRLQPAAQRTNVARFVPANDRKTYPRRGDDLKDRKIPTAFVGSDPVILFWPDAAADSHSVVLNKLAAGVASLGHPSSLVAVSFFNDLLPTSNENPHLITLRPNESGPTSLRVSTEGRLEHLLECFYYTPRRRCELNKCVTWTSYNVKSASTDPVANWNVFGDLVVFRLLGGGKLPLVSSAQVIQAFRGSVQAYADQPVMEIISGHSPDSAPEAPRPTSRPHLAYIPLPDVGHMHAGGHILGVAGVLPKALFAEERRACLRALGRASKHPLNVGRLGVWTLQRNHAEWEIQGLLEETWCKKSRVWGTVTPFVFGKYPREPFGTEVVGMVHESCRLSGLPQPEMVEVGPVSPVLGTPRSSDFPPMNHRLNKPKKYHIHLCLSFENPVPGPIMIGWGRYQGYGLCRPVKEASNV